MSIEPSSPILNLGDLTKPAVVLIEKISDAVGCLYEPTKTKRIAVAEAEAAMIKAESDIQITDLERRAARRWLKEEAIHQRNMEAQTAKAIPLLNDDANPDAMEDDWIANFFAKSRVVSDSEVQELWARLLAGEANSPGSFSRRTVNLLSDLDKDDAETFAKLCCYAWSIITENEKEYVPLVFDDNAALYKNRGIDFIALNNLESIGLIKYDKTAQLYFFSDYVPPESSSLQRYIARYFGKQILLDLPLHVDNGIRIGHTFFTKTGGELASIIRGKPVDGFYEYVKEEWKQHLPKVETSERDKIEEGQGVLDELVGFVESDSSDGSVNHDDLIC